MAAVSPERQKSIPPEHRRHLAPLMIGVGGHDDFDDKLAPQLKARTRQFLEKQLAKHPHTPLMLMTTLRTKADRLVAEVARSLGIELIVIQPWSAWMDRLPEEARRSVEDLQSVARHVQWLTNDQPTPEEQGQWLSRAAAFVVGHSQLLLLLWDGVESEQPMPGDVAQFAQFRLHGIPLEHLGHDEALSSGDVGSLAYLPTPRGAVEPNTKVGKAKPKLPQLPVKRFQRRLKRRDALLCAAIERYNRDAKRFLDEHGPEALAARPDGFDRDDADPPPDVQELWREHLLADGLAQRYQVRGQRALKTLCLLAFGLSVCLDVATWFGQTGLWSSSFAWVLAPAVYYVARGGLQLLARRGRGDRARWIDDRAIAEGQRVATYSRLAGIPDSVAGHYRRIQRSQLGWIPETLWNWNLLAFAPFRDGAGPPAGTNPTRQILNGWVLGQWRFFTNAASKAEDELHRLNVTAWTALLIGATFAIWPLLPQISPAELAMRFTNLNAATTHWLHLFEVLLRSPLAFGVLLKAYAQSEGLKKLVDQYDSMGECFARAFHSLEQHAKRGDMEGFRKLLADLSREALTENAHWVLARRDTQGAIPTVK